MTEQYPTERATPSRRAWQSVVLTILAFALVMTGFMGGAASMWLVGPRLREVVSAEGIAELTEGETTETEGYALLDDIRDILEQEYRDPEAIDDQEMLWGAAAGLVSSLGDPHTAFVEPLPSAIMSEDMTGSFEGIGATVDMVDGKLVIVRPLPGSPALDAGLQPDDIVLEVDGQSLEGMDLNDAISLIRGPRDTVVRLLVQREGTDEPFIVPVTRDKIELPIIEAEMLEGGVAYVRLTEFNAISGKRVRSALKELMDEEPVGLVFDLRGNPGGYLQMAVDIASEFLPRDVLVLTEEERGDDIKEYRVTKSGLATEIPLVVLVNGGSASASEIVAGAIRDHERGVLIGENTFGKGSVQNVHDLRDGSSLRVTIARWLLPGGDHLDGQGIEPDIAVEMTGDDYANDRDPQLDRAVEYLLKGE